MKTELKDRVLWHDGTTQANPDAVPDLFLMGVSQDKIIANELNDDLKLFNQLSDNPIDTIKIGNSAFDLEWNIPEHYKALDLEVYLKEQITKRTDGKDAYLNRLKMELIEIRDRQLENLFRTLVYIVDKLRSERKVWGVGRGSSCASLALYLIGIHEVDPIKYQIPMTEFFHD
jgi:DNA polymerase III alpha subunit